MDTSLGLKRLAVVAGAVGILLGVIALCKYLPPVVQQRATHEQFERLSNSDAVGNQRKELQARARAQGGFPLEWKYLGAPLHQDGIDRVYWAENWRVTEIETDDGVRIQPTQQPPLWPYALFFVACFAVPWFFVRGVGWVKAGFASSRHQSVE